MIWQAFVIALSFFTRIPLPRKLLDKAYEGNISLSPLFYSAVGFVIGLTLCLFQYLFGAALPSFLNATLLLCCWVAITGALHIDGFADCVDAYYASHKSPERTLEVMAEPQVGSMAVVYTCLLLLIKCAVISALIEKTDSLYWTLLFTPIVARFMVLPYMASTTYARENGMASALDLSRYSLAIYGIGISIFLALVIILTIKFALMVALMSCLLLVTWRQLWLKKINGYTGDCAGALIEICELLVLFCFLLISIS